MTTRRTVLTGLAALAFTGVAGRAQAQAIPLAELSNYLNRMTTATGGFTQINNDGTLSTGQIYIKRPGRIRFEYNEPDNSLVMAGGGQVAIFDPRSNVGVERYPLSETPLKIILEQNVDFTRQRMVTNHVSDGTKTTVTAQDPDNPQYGNIQMVFTANPVELRQWIVTDDLGEQTTVVLNDLQQGASIGDIQFNIQNAMRQRGL